MPAQNNPSVENAKKKNISPRSDITEKAGLPRLDNWPKKYRWPLFNNPDNKKNTTLTVDHTYT